VLEHIPRPTEALEELKRISKFIIFKVPLEDNIFLRVLNIIKKGKPRQGAIETIGHINVYNINKLKYQIEKYTGLVLKFYFTNVFNYYQNSEYYKNKLKMRNKLINFVAVHLFRLCPKLCSIIFTDSVMILVKCY